MLERANKMQAIVVLERTTNEAGEEDYAVSWSDGLESRDLATMAVMLLRHAMNEFNEEE